MNGKRILDIGTGVLFGLLSAGLILLVCRPGPDTVVLLRPPPTPEPIRVDVAGAVINPGVYALPAGSRVEDAVRAAGGLRDDALSAAVNLAAYLEDGEQIMIPVERQYASQPDQDAEKGGIPVIKLVNINYATPSELEELPGIGPVTAEAIIQYRSQHPFGSIQDLQKVSGIGPSTFEQIKPYLTVGE